jgi:hypothetical protein
MLVSRAYILYTCLSARRTTIITTEIAAICIYKSMPTIKLI